MSLMTPRLIARTTTKKAVLLLVTTITEVYETTGEAVEELPSRPGLAKAEPAVLAPARRVAGAR